MTIKGMGLSGNIMEAGKIKIGKKGKMIKSVKGKEFRQPTKLDHFEIVTTERDEKGDFVLATKLIKSIKKSDEIGGVLNLKGDIIGVPIRLLFDDPEKNFPTSLVSYVNGKRNCYGDGEESFKRVKEFKTPTKCPCDRIKEGYDGVDKCKPFGTLTCFIDGDDLFGSAYRFRTTSRNTVNGILGGMKAIAKVTHGRLAGIPLMLMLNCKTTEIPSGGTTTVYIVSICYRGSMTDMRKDALDLYENEQQYLLDTANDFKNPEMEKEIGEEFYPDAIDVDSKVIEKKEVINKTKISDTKENNVGENNGSTEGNSDNLDPAGEKNSVKCVLTEEELIKFKPGSDYQIIYDRFLTENDFAKAYSLAKRLQKNHICYWLATKYCDVPFDKKANKPVLLETVREVLKTVLDGKTKSEPSIKKIKDAGGADVKKSPEERVEVTKEKPVREFDDSGKITVDQLRKIVQLKSVLIKTCKLKNDPEVWDKHVAYFLDAEGELIKTAKALTKTQGSTFINMLEKYDDIPF